MCCLRTAEGVIDRPAVRAFVGIGANQGDVRAALVSAIAAMAAMLGTQSLRSSSFYATAPQDAAGPDFINGVIELHTKLAPHELLAELRKIELAHGRERPYRNAPRTLDLDVLLHGDSRIDTPELTVPHPRLHLRAFVLMPLAELAPELVIPGRGPVAALLPAVANQRIDKLAP